MNPLAFHIGYHKTATTWLQQEILPVHPGIAAHCPPSVKGSPFLREIVITPDRDFDPETARTALRTLVATPAPDQLVVISSEHLSGHASTGGFDAFRTADRLAEVAPGAKVFFVVREQVEMIESEYRQLVFEGTPARLDRLVRRSGSTRVPGFDLGHYEYDRLADHYTERFGPGHVRVFDFAAILREPRAFLDALAEFLELAPWPDLPDTILRKRVNATLPQRLIGVRRALNHFQRTELNPDPVVAMRPVWRTPLWAIATRLPKPHDGLLDAPTRSELRARYGPSNERLADRYGVRFTTS